MSAMATASERPLNSVGVQIIVFLVLSSLVFLEPAKSDDNPGESILKPVLEEGKQA